jgi:hypothetical protein
MGLLPFLEGQIRSWKGNALAERLAGLMEKGRVVLLLDGLNELPRLRRDGKSQMIDDPRARAIAGLGEKARWRNVGCVLSCRVKEFKGGPQWQDLHILDITREQIAAFANAFYRDVPEAGLAEKFLSELFKGQDARAEKLRALAARPFWLILLLYYYLERERRGEGLPDNLPELFENTVKEALDQVVRTGRMTHAQASEVRKRLGLLAFNLTDAEYLGGTDDKELAASWMFHRREQEFQDGSGGSVPKPTPAQTTRARKWWQGAKEAGLLDVTEHGIYYSHQLFQEYFCAQYCLQQGLTLELLERTTYPAFDEIWPLWAKLDQDPPKSLVRPRLLGNRPKLLVRLLQLLDRRGGADDVIRRNAAYALGRVGDRDAVEPLIAALVDPEIGVRREVARALGRIGDRDAVEPLIAALEDSDLDVRLEASYALGRIGDQRAVEPLISFLRDGCPESTLSSAKALTWIGEPAVVPLLGAIESLRGLALRDAVRALGWIGDPRSLPLLEAIQHREELNEEIHTGRGILSQNVATNAIESIRKGLPQQAGNP